VIRLLRLVSLAVRWATRTPRRVIGVLAVPVLIAVALVAGPVRDHQDTPVAAPPGTTAAPTPTVYGQITTVDPRRGDYQWRQWLTGKATVEVTVLATGVPDGAPAPTATTAYTRVRFRQTVRPTAGAQSPTSTVDVLNLLVTRGDDGRWLVSRLLADV
jgi:hypothetical protein